MFASDKYQHNSVIELNQKSDLSLFQLATTNVDVYLNFQLLIFSQGRVKQHRILSSTNFIEN